VEVGVGHVAVAAQAALAVGGFAAAVLFGEVATEFLLAVGVVRLVASAAGKLRGFQAGLVGEAAAVLVVALLPLALKVLRNGLVLLA
jgi:hypothetical protein